MTISEYLNNLIQKISVDREEKQRLYQRIEEPLKDVISKKFQGLDKKFRQGGSLAKGTAISETCDIDFLAYFSEDTKYSLKEIYNLTYDALVENGYYTEKKNNAICVKGKDDDVSWGLTVDVVPGKYRDFDDKNVTLYCNKTNTTMLSNPEKQIGRVSSCKSKDVIKIIKHLSYVRNFKIKSFYLENFIIKFIEPSYKEGDGLQIKLIKFAKEFNKIGKVKLLDPANSNNDVSDIHDYEEFKRIRSEIKNLYEVLLTNDVQGLKEYLEKGDTNIEECYKRNAVEHCNKFHFHNNNNKIFLSARLKNDLNQDVANNILSKNANIKFVLKTFYPISNLKLIVSNSGFESIGDLRGDYCDFDGKLNDFYYRDEHTSYNGNHYVQAVCDYNGIKIYSNIIIIRVRDF